ncbi:MAG: DUF6141 family protein [Patescibacteria group bacterium]
MENEILFAETQKFKQWWLWILLAGIPVLFFFGAYAQIGLGIQLSDKPMTDTKIILASLFCLLPLVLFYSFKLETEIKLDGLYVRFFPLHITFRKYAWPKMTKCFVRQYKPVREYGGWGLRGLGKKRALSVSGDQGLQLEFVSGNTLLIGTAKPAELTEVLKKIGKLKQ